MEKVGRRTSGDLELTWIRVEDLGWGVSCFVHEQECGVLHTAKASVEADGKAAGVMVERDRQGHRPCRVVDNGSGVHLGDFH